MHHRIVAGGHVRVRPFNTGITYPEQTLSNDLCQAVIAGDTIYLRGQVAQDLETREDVGVGDPAAQAEQVMDNIELLLGECDATLAQIASSASCCAACTRASPGSSWSRSRGPRGSSR
jgi:enamine deaminase RidA (YjgF/YER057c/UK114 family)